MMRRLIRRLGRRADTAVEAPPAQRELRLLFEVVAEKRYRRETEGRQLFQELARRRAEASPTTDEIGGGEAAAITAAASRARPHLERSGRAPGFRCRTSRYASRSRCGRG